MYQPKMEKDIRCPLEYGLATFGGKWKSRIICVLAAQAPLRYSVLRKEMGNITILQQICQWAGAYHKEEQIHPMIQCEKCDYR